MPEVRVNEHCGAGPAGASFEHRVGRVDSRGLVACIEQACELATRPDTQVEQPKGAWRERRENTAHAKPRFGSRRGVRVIVTGGDLVEEARGARKLHGRTRSQYAR